MAETYIVKVSAEDLIKLLEQAKNKEALSRCLHVFADVPADTEVEFKIEAPKIA